MSNDNIANPISYIDIWTSSAIRLTCQSTFSKPAPVGQNYVAEPVHLSHYPSGWTRAGMSILQTPSAITLAEQIALRLARTAPNSQAKAVNDLLQVSLRPAGALLAQQARPASGWLEQQSSKAPWVKEILLCSWWPAQARTGPSYYFAVSLTKPLHKIKGTAFPRC